MIDVILLVANFIYVTSKVIIKNEITVLFLSKTLVSKVTDGP
jgi:hypothetical protein